MSPKPITRDEEIKINRIAEKFHEHDNQRKGQAYFNALHAVRPDLANYIRGTRADPFYQNFDNYGQPEVFFQFIRNIKRLDEFLSSKIDY